MSGLAVASSLLQFSALMRLTETRFRDLRQSLPTKPELESYITLLIFFTHCGETLPLT